MRGLAVKGRWAATPTAEPLAVGGLVGGLRNARPDPGQVAAKPYKLLVKALGRSAEVAVAKYAWSGRERLGILRIRDDVLVLHAMRRPDEIRDPAESRPPPTEVTEEEIPGALALMDTRDHRQAGGGRSAPTGTPRRSRRSPRRSGRRSRFRRPRSRRRRRRSWTMAALRESVQKAKASRTGDAGPAQVHDLPAPTRKTAAKKQPARLRG
ncbi:hypothetical protein GTW30_00240 [Streptomyces sp. SID7810]|nr:hypothetical protein [Streptomyces sp. SID7810]